MANLEDMIETAKDKLPDITPTPPHFHSQTNAHELKSRLDWGEPALTILDVRDRAMFLECHIMGAMSLSLEQLQQGQTPNMAHERDIYVYGSNDQETATAANLIRQAGFEKVAELQGGLADWREIGGAVEGRETEFKEPGADEYNVVSRMQEFAKERASEDQLKQQMP